MSDENATVELDVTGSEPEPRRRLGRGARIGLIVAGSVVGVAALLVAADVIARGIAEQRVADEVRASLPAGVEGDVDVTIGGFSVITQYLSGTMERVSLSAPELVVDGAPLDVEVDLRGVPVDLGSPVDRLDATVSAEQDAVNSLVRVPNATGSITLGDATVGYEGALEVFGQSIAYQVTATPTAAGSEVLLQPVGVEIGAGGGSIDLSGIVERVLGGDPVAVCVAERLPAGVEVTDIAAAPGVVRVELEGSEITLDEAHLRQSGSCD
ncbi:LmeA family phospholipid-binding protein [Agromyces italicus]|uniref:LmeA family phospholipid-binding protein n=1 Tax=Agromyces italicus TaxID=279572 RepID=UPI0003B5E744|nr:DUF2993 domain-containing protein [Agromyces italicus]